MLFQSMELHNFERGKNQGKPDLEKLHNFEKKKKKSECLYFFLNLLKIWFLFLYPKDPVPVD